MKLFSRLLAAILAAISLSACVGAAVVPVPVASSRPTTTYYYSDSYRYPDAVYYETYRYP